MQKSLETVEFQGFAHGDPAGIRIINFAFFIVLYRATIFQKILEIQWLPVLSYNCVKHNITLFGVSFGV